MNAQQKEDGPEISPSVVFLYDLLKWVRQGRIRVPSFQRSFVWTRQNMLDLFDSVRWSYPIGTLLFWRSSVETARPHSRFGPFDLSKTQPTETLLLLDGQQRLTTLAGVLLQKSSDMTFSDHDEDPGRWNIYFDASTDKGGSFMHMPNGEQPKVWQVPLHQLRDTGSLFQAVGNIFSVDGKKFEGAGRTKEFVAEQLQSIARALQSYKIPIVEFVTDDLNLAVESFTRLNRKGVSIGADEMFSALTYQAGKAGERFHIAREIDQTLKEIKEIGFGEVDRVLVLRAFFVAVGLHPYRTDWPKLSETAQTDVANQLPEAMERARSGLIRAIEFLREESVYNARMLPYGLHLVGLSAWLGEDEKPSSEAKRLLRRWFWLTGFASWFGQGNPARYAAGLAELRDTARKVCKEGGAVPNELEHLPWTTPTAPFPERYDLRSARVRTLLCLLAKDGVSNLNDSHKNAQEIAEDFVRNGPEAMRSIWRVTTAVSPLSSSPANRMFDVFGKERGQARTLLKKREVGPEFLESHLLPPSIKDALQTADAMQQALQYRLDKMIERERSFMSELELTLPSSRTGAATIDQEDDAPLPDVES